MLKKCTVLVMVIALAIFIAVSSIVAANATDDYSPQLLTGFANVIYYEAITGGGTQVFIYERPESVKYEDQKGYLYIDPMYNEEHKVFLEILKEAFGEGKDGYVKIYGLGYVDGEGKIVMDNQVWTISIQRTSEVNVFGDPTQQQAALERIKNLSLQNSSSQSVNKEN